MQQAASILVKDAKFIMTVGQKQWYSFSFFHGSRRTFRAHLDEMRKLGLSHNLGVNLSVLIYKIRIMVILRIK